MRGLFLILGLLSAVLPSAGQACQDLGESCLTKDPDWTQFTCAYAKEYCENHLYSETAKKCCQATCGVCTPTPSIVDNAIATEKLSTLVTVLTTPEYKPVLDTLQGDGPFTVFAPTNEAFKAAGLDLADVSPANVAVVTAVLQYHVVSGAFSAQDLVSKRTVATLQGEKVEIINSGRGFFASFAVFSKSKTSVEGAKFVKVDVQSSNGVVHFIDQVLMPPKRMATPSIVENAIATKTLSTLVKVLTMPEYKPVLDVLQGDGPFTVFAPTDEAFQAAGLDLTDVAAVTAVLQYHVVSGAFYAGDLSETQQVATLQGNKVLITKQNGKVTVQGAKVVVADVRSSNGVVHVIDQVLEIGPADEEVESGSVGISSGLVGHVLAALAALCIAH